MLGCVTKMCYHCVTINKTRNKMKVLKQNVDFVKAFALEPKVGDTFLMKKSVATGWGKLCVVTRVMKSQLEVEVVNVVPTEESNRFGTKNGFKDRHKAFFEDWAFDKKVWVGKKVKFFKDNAVQVGDTDNWNQTVLCELL